MQVVPEDELWLHLSRAQFFASISNGTNRQFLVGNAPCLPLILVKMCPRVKSFGCSGIVILILTHLYKANFMFFPLKYQDNSLHTVSSQNAKTKSTAFSFTFLDLFRYGWRGFVILVSLGYDCFLERKQQRPQWPDKQQEASFSQSDQCGRQLGIR